MISPKTKLSLSGVLLGLLYGVGLRGIAQVPGALPYFQLMSVGFLCLGPFAIGVLSVRSGETSLPAAFFWPTVPVTLACLATLLLHWEGSICIAMYLPLGIVFGGIGGLTAREFRRAKKKSSLSVMVLLPLLAGPIEAKLPAPSRLHEVRSEIVIQASKAKVWREIQSVRTISRSELADSWVHRLGFPRPLDAQIDHAGVGGVRLARFERGLVFHETVDAWVPEKELSFRIVVDPASIPPTTLDEHVTIGGPYFDVLHGAYSIEDRHDGSVVLHLVSQFRLSTHFNGYAGAWSTLIMNRIQSDIMSVIRKRAEG